MFSDVIKAALEKEIAGQPQAVASVVRGITRAVSGLVPREGPRCAYMFIGPTGTGKTHTVRTVARILHGDDRRLVIADCIHFASGDPWNAFAGQMAPLFVVPRMEGKWSVLDTAPFSIILIDYLERGRPEVSKALAAALETGRLALPEGRQGSLRNCLVFITSTLCSREILDDSAGIGFAGGTDDEYEEGQRKLLRTCQADAQEHFGADLIGRLDSLVVFHRLEEQHLAGILDRLLHGLNQELVPRGFQCELLTAAREFLLARGRRNLRLGSRDLVRAHRRFVEFPIADLMVSGRLLFGSLVQVDHLADTEHLHFSIKKHAADEQVWEPETMIREVPVEWPGPEAGSAVH